MAMKKQKVYEVVQDIKHDSKLYPVGSMLTPYDLEFIGEQALERLITLEAITVTLVAQNTNG